MPNLCLVLNFCFFSLLELYFSNVWLSISEVNFDSVPAPGIYPPEKAPSQQITAVGSNSATAEKTNQETESSTQESAKTQGKGADIVSHYFYMHLEDKVCGLVCFYKQMQEVFSEK